MEKIIKDRFSVIGRCGSTEMGPGFVQKLWKEANTNFNEVYSLAKKDEHGNIVGFYGAMSDLSLSFKPWEDNFSRGLYLAGVEVEDDAIPPNGWTKWTIPGFEYLKVEFNKNDTFIKTINYLKENNIPLVGAVHDYTDPKDGKNYMLFPIRKI